MKREDLAPLTNRLTELSHYYDRKPPNNDALRVWMDCLEGVCWEDVACVLTDWPKVKRSFPTGDEVRKLAATRVSERLEEAAKRNNQTAGTVDSLVAVAADTPNARSFKRMWYAIRTKKVTTPREWCERVMASDKATGELKAFAVESLKLMGNDRPKGQHAEV